uniref:F-box protein At1g23770 n=2 Tax=Elaeis guineensis var. tenera TaxID=51953 RepID=A0A6I9Q806_ELAGV|nr:putative F-box protein At1g23770 [Elaeis guineensis]
MRVMTDEKAKSKGNLGRLVIAVHAVFLDCGFVLADAGEPLLPDGWHSPSATVSVRYTLPKLLSPLPPESNGTAVVLSFSATALDDVSINGSLDQPDSRIYRISFDISKLAGPLIKSMHGMNEKEEKKVLKLWRTVSDELSRPLLIEICSKNGLPVPYSLMSLPTDLKTRILDFLPGVDLARMQCVCAEWKQLASSDQLWKQKFEEEFGSWAVDSATWKEIARYWGLVNDTWKEKYATGWMAMRWNDANNVGGPLPRFQSLRRGPSMISFLLGPSRSLQPPPYRNPWRTDGHRLVLFHSSSTFAPIVPFPCPLGHGVWFNW